MTLTGGKHKTLVLYFLLYMAHCNIRRELRYAHITRLMERKIWSLLLLHHCFSHLACTLAALIIVKLPLSKKMLLHSFRERGPGVFEATTAVLFDKDNDVVGKQF